MSPVPALGPIGAMLALVTLAVLFTRAWLAEKDDRAAEQLRVLGLRKGPRYQLGGTWTRAAARDPRNALWGVLALGAWTMLMVALILVRR